MKTFLLYTSWFAAIASVMGSLFFSEVLHFTPCTLCWYQRIFMYPLALLFFVGLYFKDKMLPKYVFTLAVPGTLFAAYQYGLQLGLIKVSEFCTFGESCSARLINWFGFVTIPFLSLIAFAYITGAMAWILIKKL